MNKKDNDLFDEDDEDLLEDDDIDDFDDDYDELDDDLDSNDEEVNNSSSIFDILNKSENGKELSKELRKAKQNFYDGYGYCNSSEDRWDDFYELKRQARKELDKGNITRKEYDKLLRDAEDKCR